MGVPQAVSIAAQVAEGLAHAHQQGVVHRDIKPANIMVVADGPVKITDFGIARMRASADLTQTGVMLGSPNYMSPEQVIGKRADHRSDIFSLGVILYEMLTGAAPFSGENVTALMYQIVNFALPAPSSINRQVPEMLDFVVAKMLAKPLDERYQDARELAKDLRECERGLSAPGIGTLPGRPTGLASGPHREMMNTQSKAVVLAQTVNRTRSRDQALEDSVSASGGRRLAFLRLERGHAATRGPHRRRGLCAEQHAGAQRRAARAAARLAPARLASHGRRRGRRRARRDRDRQTPLVSFFRRRPTAWHRPGSPCSSSWSCPLQGGHEGDFESVLLVPGADRAVLATIHFIRPCLGSSFSIILTPPPAPFRLPVFSAALATCCFAGSAPATSACAAARSSDPAIEGRTQATRDVSDERKTCHHQQCSAHSVPPFSVSVLPGSLPWSLKSGSCGERPHRDHWARAGRRLPLCHARGKHGAAASRDGCEIGAMAASRRCFRAKPMRCARSSTGHGKARPARASPKCARLPRTTLRSSRASRCARRSRRCGCGA